MSRLRDRSAYTLVELVVVLVLLGLAATLAGPLLRSPDQAPEPALTALLSGARNLAVRRGETVRLTLDPSGAWSISGTGQPADVALAQGRMDESPGAPLTLFFSPLATCGPDPAAVDLPALEPLACREVRP